MTETKSYRYPGVQPFRTLDCDIFFGRENEIDKLFKLLMLEKLVVLFGKSGYGKSSLINAGIIPILKEHPKLRFQYQTIEVRIGKIAGIEESPVQKVISKINEQFSDLPEWSFLDKFPNIPSFWAQLKKKQSAGNNKFLLIFDQFEEFFNYSEKDQEIFRWELADLLYTDIPQTVLEHLPDINDNQYSLLSSPLNVKVLFSIRSDRLSMLHSMKDALPVILQTRFEIRGLRSDQARDAIIQPASKEDKKFSTLPFEYDEQAIDVILKEL